MDEAFRIRPARLADAPALAEIERRCFTDPWSQASFGEVLNDGAWYFGLIADRGDDAILGYLIARETAGSAEILNLAVVPEARRLGIGRALLEAGLARLAARGAVEVHLEVRESNSAARELYLGYGFKVVGERRSYYRSPRENALVLRATLPIRR